MKLSSVRLTSVHLDCHATVATCVYAPSGSPRMRLQQLVDNCCAHGLRWAHRAMLPWIRFDASVVANNQTTAHQKFGDQYAAPTPLTPPTPPTHIAGGGRSPSAQGMVGRSSSSTNSSLSGVRDRTARIRCALTMLLTRLVVESAVPPRKACRP